MIRPGEPEGPLLCPSAQPDIPGAIVFGVVEGSAARPRVIYLRRALPVAQDVLALARPVDPTEVFRFAAPCALEACQHFEAGACSLATRIAQLVSGEGLGIPACRIRPRCRWWSQEGKAACERCPGIVTLAHTDHADIRQAATPAPR